MPLDHSQVAFLVIADDQVGQRLDNFLLTRLKGLPKSRLYRLLRKGEIRVNKKRVAPAYRLVEGDSVRLPPIRLEQKGAPMAVSKALAEHLMASVIFENDDYLVLNKPAGLAVHGGSGVHLGVIEALRQLHADGSRLELVHRLDRDTSGCLLIARKRSALKSAHALFRENKVNKTYLAVVKGRWPAGLTVVNAPLRKNTLLSGERMVVTAADGKPSRTRFKLLRHIGPYSLVEASPETGRTHQIRVHALAAGFPLCGDSKYGDETENRVLREKGYRFLFLHALRLQLHPQAEPLAVESPVPPAWIAFEEQITGDDNGAA